LLPVVARVGPLLAAVVVLEVFFKDILELFQVPLTP
jgi:hypothetical protein